MSLSESPKFHQSEDRSATNGEPLLRVTQEQLQTYVEALRTLGVDEADVVKYAEYMVDSQALAARADEENTIEAPDAPMNGHEAFDLATMTISNGVSAQESTPPITKSTLPMLLEQTKLVGRQTARTIREVRNGSGVLIDVIRQAEEASQLARERSLATSPVRVFTRK